MSGFQTRFCNLAGVGLASVALCIGGEALRALGDASLLMLQISLELCQMGIAVLRVCGI